MTLHASFKGCSAQPVLIRHPGFTPAAAADPWSAIGMRQTVARNREIYAEGERADRIFKVVSGAVRTFELTEDGRRQVNAFYLPGEVFGLEADGDYRFYAEAIVETTILAVRRERVGDRPEMLKELWQLTAAELARAQQHFMLLGRRTATERVAWFLVSLADRLHADGAITITLPMGRQDMADYLGLTIETVSRTMTQLDEAGLIELHGARLVHISRPERLKSAGH
jgi:CRP/FNR family nitrogen fixation transcriptional regulator